MDKKDLAKNSLKAILVLVFTLLLYVFVLSPMGSLWLKASAVEKFLIGAAELIIIVLWLIIVLAAYWLGKVK